jgi:hypothetical protein
MVADGVDAWNRRDPKAVTAHDSASHDHVNVVGEWRQGNAETEKAMTAALATTILLGRLPGAGLGCLRPI